MEEETVITKGGVGTPERTEVGVGDRYSSEMKTHGFKGDGHRSFNWSSGNDVFLCFTRRHSRGTLETLGRPTSIVSFVEKNGSKH